MDNIKLIKDNKDAPKLYSLSGIGLATFLGAPIGGSILIRENYKALNQARKGDIALIYGISTTLLIFAFIFMVPKDIIQYIPNQLIPAIYTGATTFLANYYQGDALKSNEEIGINHISKWKAFAIGLISLLFVGSCLFGFIYWEANTPVNKEYNRQIDKFIDNENATATFYDNLAINPYNQLIDELNNKTIPYWKKNRAIIDTLDGLNGISQELLNRNKILREYCELRIEEYTIFRRAVMLNTDIYAKSIDSIHLLIEEKLIELDE